MVNDILEQIVDDYLQSQGYFTQHNVKYRPDISGMPTKKKQLYSVHSDIDVLAIHPYKKGKDRVVAVSCKSWQGGMNIDKVLKDFSIDLHRVHGIREIWKTFRELTDPVWAKAMKVRIGEITGRQRFVFYLALIKYQGEREKWEQFRLFRSNLKGCEIKLIDLGTMVKDLYKNLTTTPAHSDLSRLLQLLKASGVEINYE